MLHSFSLVVLLACLFSLSLASLPSRSNLRFNEVTGNTLGPNSVSQSEIQDYAVDRQALMNRAVSQAKMAPLAVNSEQIAPGAVTTSGASLDLVTLIIKAEDTIPAESQAVGVAIPEGPQSVQPHEAMFNPSQTIVDSPNPANSYRVEGKARGGGVILGWYPSRNGHLLRYQSSRALRGIVCSNIDIEDIAFGCTCDVFEHICTCGVTYDDTDFVSSIPNCAACTVLDCGNDALSGLPDPQCDSNPPEDDDDDDVRPDRCGSYTSVEDVLNPQEGVPIYSPSVERVTIDDTGRVELRFFGRGSVEGFHDDIEITVVVLLDEQYGA